MIRTSYSFAFVGRLSRAAFVGVAAWGIYWNDKSASARAELTWVDAVNQADFVPCGEKRICANVDLKAEPISGKYRPVKPRD